MKVIGTDNVAVSQTSSDDAAGSNNVSSQAETDTSQRSRRSATQLQIPAYENESSSGSQSQRSSSGRLIKPTPAGILSREQRRPQGTKRKATVSESSSWEDQGMRKKSRLGETADRHETPGGESPSPSAQLTISATPIIISNGESDSRTERRDPLTQGSQGTENQDLVSQQMSSDDNRHNLGDNLQGGPASLLSPITQEMQPYKEMILSPETRYAAQDYEGFLRRRRPELAPHGQRASPEAQGMLQIAVGPINRVAPGPVLSPFLSEPAPHRDLPRATPEISDNSGYDSIEDTPAVIRQKRAHQDAEREAGRFLTP